MFLGALCSKLWPWLRLGLRLWLGRAIKLIYIFTYIYHPSPPNAVGCRSRRTSILCPCPANESTIYLCHLSPNLRLDNQKPAAGALQTIFVKWVSSGHLLVLKRGIFTCASRLKWTCIHHDTPCWVRVNGSQRESTTCKCWICEHLKCGFLMH